MTLRKIAKMKILLMAALLGFLVSCSKSSKVDPNKVIATVGEYRITAGDFQKALNERYKNKPLSELTAEEKRTVLDEMVDARRKAIWAVKNGLTDDADYQADLQKYSDRILAMALYDRKVLDELFPPAVMARYNDWYFSDVKAVIVKIGYKGSHIESDRSEEEARALAEKYAEELQKSLDPVLAAKTLTEGNKKAVLADPYTIGRLPMAGDSLIFTTPVGKVGGPLKLSQGIVLVKVLDKKQREKNRDPEMVRQELLRIFRGQKRNEEAKLFEQISRELREKYNATANDSAINVLVNDIKKWAKKRNPQMSDFSSAQRALVLGSVRDFKLTAEDFFNYAGTALLRDPAAVGNFSTIKERYVVPELNLKCWVLAAREAGLADDPEIVKKLEDFRINRLVQLLEQKEVNQRIVNVSEEEIVAYYNEHPDQFSYPERIEVYQIVVNSRDIAEKVLERARAGEDFKKLYDEYVGTEKVPVTDRYELGKVTRTHRMREIAEAAFAAGGNAITGPVEFNKKFHIIKTGKYEPVKLKPLEDVRSSVMTAVINQKRKEYRQALEAQLRETIPASIEPDWEKVVG